MILQKSVHRGLEISQRLILTRISYTSLAVAVILLPLSYGRHPSLFLLVIALVFLDGIALHLGRSGHVRAGLNVCLLSHAVGFVLAPFVGIAGLCDSLIFPIIFIWALFSLEGKIIRIVYFLVCTTFIITTVYRFRIAVLKGETLLPADVDLVIVFSSMVCLFLIARLYFEQLANFEQHQSEKEEMIRAKNVELKEYIESNLQLENFAHIASHELKSPVRSVSNYAGLLRYSAQDKLSGKEVGYLDFIEKESTKMFNLTSDLLELSKLSNEITKKELNDPNEHIRRLIETDFGAYVSQIHLDRLPGPLWVNGGQFLSLLKNLIENAIKYSDISRKLEIRISGHTSTEYHHILVEDNGIGIPDDQKEKAFLIFKRLQSTGEGTGIGLATCKLIAQKHGGDIKIRDSESGGTLVEVLIPYERGFNRQ